MLSAYVLTEADCEDTDDVLLDLQKVLGLGVGLKFGLGLGSGLKSGLGLGLAPCSRTMFSSTCRRCASKGSG